MKTSELSIYSIHNLLSLLRLTLVPMLIVSAYMGCVTTFLVVLAISLLSDVLDGYLARKLNQVSELGAKLDSWGDMLTYGSMILGLYWIWPDVFFEQAAYLLATMIFFIAPVALALSKFGEYPSYHTWGAKVAAVLMAPAYYMLVLWGADQFFRGVILLHVLVACEEIVITLLLSRPRSNVRSVFSLRPER
jgi:phosphatidylglycerophosphate synthase